MAWSNDVHRYGPPQHEHHRSDERVLYGGSESTRPTERRRYTLAPHYCEPRTIVT
ncbi:hypothetical protein [Haloprofundus marisrubri]|uniref:hypothetical protein n=1 Tax=Haloprofundus marisrubri TaxID=1514971 RepID=UPI0012BAD8EE|nr:hypothetical protein [Haloprofundus marisrubri]